MAKATEDIVSRYAYRFWAARKMTAWPTVREVARATKLSQREIDACAGDKYGLSGYNVEEVVLGDLIVEADTPEVERDFCNYWKGFARCICGQHPERM